MLGRVTAGLFFILLIWGNLVAGMQAGMACPDWPLCQGTLLPPLHVDVWMEFLHRVIAAVAATSLFLLARRRIVAYQGLQKGIPLAAMGLIALEILLGGIVVVMGLPVQITTVHFMIGLAIFLLVLYMAVCDGTTSPATVSVSGYAGLLFCVLLLVFFQASLGAYLRHSAAGLACPDFPTCQGRLIPEIWDRPIATNFTHRLVALGTLCTALVLYLVSLLDQRLKRMHGYLLALLCLVALQIGVGAAVVKTGLSYPITSLHLAMTLGIIGTTLRIWMLQTGEAGRSR
ncbi:MAG TPA: COX15/CtaA family protein [Geomonas sp.]|nr:COX15/CtaA family protein [Geomonas sp.]HJV37091.1 COX15/CtaA family protein [Geomonas sp.]